MEDGWERLGQFLDHCWDYVLRTILNWHRILTECEGGTGFARRIQLYRANIFAVISIGNHRLCHIHLPQLTAERMWTCGTANEVKEVKLLLKIKPGLHLNEVLFRSSLLQLPVPIMPQDLLRLLVLWVCVCVYGQIWDASRHCTTRTPRLLLSV